MGASSTNASEIAPLANEACALKMYLNETYTTLRMDSMSDWVKVSGEIIWNFVIVLTALNDQMVKWLGNTVKLFGFDNILDIKVK